jgi:hypothetical protein
VRIVLVLRRSRCTGTAAGVTGLCQASGVPQNDGVKRRSRHGPAPGIICGVDIQWVEPVRPLGRPLPSSRGITSRPLLLHAIGKETTYAGRTTVTITRVHGEYYRARWALTRIVGFFAQPRKTAEQLTGIERWSRILRHALTQYLAPTATSDAPAAGVNAVRSG